MKRQISQSEFTILMAAITSVVALAIDAMLPALGDIGRELGAAHANDTQLVVSFLFLGLLCGQVFWGPFSDAYGRHAMLWGGLSLFCVGAFICFQAQSMGELLIGRIIQGFGAAGPHNAAITIIRDRFEGRDMARIMSLVMMIFIMVPALAPAIGMGILMLTSWRGLFVLYILFGIFIMAWCWLRLDESLPKGRRIPLKLSRFRWGYGQVFQQKASLCYMVAIGLNFSVLIGYLSSSVQIFADLFDITDDFPLYFGGLALIYGGAALVNSAIVKRLGMRFLCKIAAFAMVIGGAIMVVWLASYEVAGQSADQTIGQVGAAFPLWGFMGFVALAFITLAFQHGNLNALAMQPLGHVAGIATSLVGVISQMVALTGGLLIGQLYDGSLWVMVIAFLLIGVGNLTLQYMADWLKAKAAA